MGELEEHKCVVRRYVLGLPLLSVCSKADLLTAVVTSMLKSPVTSMLTAVITPELL